MPPFLNRVCCSSLVRANKHWSQQWITSLHPSIVLLILAHSSLYSFGHPITTNPSENSLIVRLWDSPQKCCLQLFNVVKCSYFSIFSSQIQTRTKLLLWLKVKVLWIPNGPVTIVHFLPVSKYLTSLLFCNQRAYLYDLISCSFWKFILYTVEWLGACKQGRACDDFKSYHIAL